VSPERQVEHKTKAGLHAFGRREKNLKHIERQTQFASPWAREEDRQIWHADRMKNLGLEIQALAASNGKEREKKVTKTNKKEGTTYPLGGRKGKDQPKRDGRVRELGSVEIASRWVDGERWATARVSALDT